MTSNKLTKASLARQTAYYRLKESNELGIKLSTDESCKSEFLARADEIDIVFDEFRTAHNTVISLINDEDFLEYDKLRMLADQAYYGVKSRKNDLLLKASSLNTSFQAQSQPPKVTARIPKLSIPTFSGNFRDWPSFFDLFNSIIHNNHDLSDVEKFRFLLTSLSQEPLALIKGIPLTDSNYQIAYDILEKRYQNKRILATQYYNDIFHAPAVQKCTCKDLRNLLNIFTENVAALRVLSFPVEHWDFLLFNLLLNKLDTKTRTDFELENSLTHDIPTYRQLISFLERHCNALESVQFGMSSAQFSMGKPTQNISQSSNKRSTTSSFFTETEPSNNGSKCLLCSSRHPLYKCQVFLSKGPHERFSLVKQHHLCVNCLISPHSVKNCSSSHKCRICKAPHHTTLHFKIQPLTKPVNSFNQPTLTEIANVSADAVPTTSTIGSPTSLISSHDSSGNKALPLSTVLLSTCIVHIQDSNGNFQKIRALLDTGSMANFISDTCVRRLGLSRKRLSIPIEGLDGMSTCTSNGVIQCLIKPCDQDYPSFSLDAIIVNKVCSNQPKIDINYHELSHIHSLQLADHKFYQPGPIDMLIGAELVPFILKSGRKFGKPNQPVAIETIFGYILQGKVSVVSENCNLTTLHTSIDTHLDFIVQRFWEVENISKPPLLSQEDQQCEEIYSSLTIREPSGRFFVPLPFRQPNPIFYDTYSQAYRRFCMLENRFIRNPALKTKYVEFMKDYLDSKHMIPVPPGDFKSPVSYYIAHHAVFKEEIVGSTLRSKIRVVFDASLRDVQGLSLNDTLYTGPKLQRDISDLLLNFRFFRYCFTCDIKQMYRQINVHQEFWNYQRIIFRFDSSKPLQEYFLRTVTYGVSASPYLALKTLQELASLEESRFPLAAQALKRHFYVDDGLLGSNSISSARALQLELIELLKCGGFQLGKWASNAPSLLEGFASDTQDSCSFDKDEPSFVKVLGLRWNPNSDVFSYSYTPLNNGCSKRTILSEISRIFDPLGFVSPCLLLAKRLLQRLWQSNVPWDDEPPEDVRNVWHQFKSEMVQLAQIQVPRHFGLELNSRVELHGFCDASEVGYASVIYLRFETSLGSTKVMLVCAKCRVSPLKTQSIARLELLAAVLLTDLVTFVTESYRDILAFHTLYLWSDSMIALNWVTSSPHKWKIFIANRVRHIQELVPVSSWHYVPSHQNPADCASRGLTPAQLLGFSPWWDGPQFLYQTRECWPSQSFSQISFSPDVLEEKGPTVLVTFVDSQNFISLLLSKFSSLPKIKRIVAYVMQFISNLRKKRDGKRLSDGPLPLELSFLSIIRSVQHEVFADIFLKIEKNMLLSKPLRRLAPFVDDCGLLRVGGRLEKSQFSFDVKHPLLLPKTHRLTELIIESTHEANLHPGLKAMHYLLLQRFWILSPKSAIYHCLSKCIRCFRCKPKSYNPFMADLPSIRVSPLRAFLSVCLDFAGPFFLLMSKHRGAKTYKGYVCVFVCTATKAVHLEVTSDLSSEAFLACFRRFIARRGQCTLIRSDQGTNLKGASNELVKLAQAAAQTLSISWSFNPPGAPHFNGLAEAAVKSFKNHFYRVLGTQILCYEEFYTLMTQIEAVLNSRPLCASSSDPNDLQALTPAHFLVFEPLVSSIPEPELSLENISRLNRWQLIQRIRGDFWKRWSREYINTLQERSKWCEMSPPVTEGSLVLIKDDQKPPLHWRLARVIKLHSGTDNIVRVVTLRTASDGILQRPVVKICPLPTN